MKCIKKGKEIRRVSNAEAFDLIDRRFNHFSTEMGWEYVPKWEWKSFRNESK